MPTRFAFLIPILLLLGSCAVSTTDTVVTMPSLSTSKEDRTTSPGALPATMAMLPFANQTSSEFAFEVVRQTMYNHFASSNYRWLHWRDVDRRLALAGITSEAELFAKSPAEIAGLLGVEGLIYGNVTHYDKTFAGIYSQVAVGVQLTMKSADGTVLWEVKDVQRSHAGGISTTPVGLLLNALVSAKHILGDINLYRAADELGRDIAGDLPQPETRDQKRRPQISQLVHSGVGQYLNYGDTIDFALEGDPGLSAAVFVDGLGLVDLVEQSPGQYVAEFPVSRDLTVSDAVVEGRLIDDYGQTSAWISPFGLLNIDNTPPPEVQNVQQASRDGAVSLDWQRSPAQDITGYQVLLASTETGDPEQSFEVADSSFLLTGLDNFKVKHVAIVAVDRAGNLSPATRVPVVAAPDPRFASATDPGSNLPGVIRGTHRLVPQGNPYFLRGKTRIATDGVLLIAPGVQIQVTSGATLEVLGELQIFGSAAVPVTAVAASKAGFSEFLVLQSSLPVSIKGLTVTDAGIPIQVNAGSPSIQDSNLLNCQFNCLTISGSARPDISGTVISGAMASGVVISGQSQPKFRNNRFLDNAPFHLQNSSTYGLDATGNTFDPAASNMTILGDVTY